MPTVDQYNAWKAGRERENVGAANVVIGSQEDQQPDQVAGDMALATDYAKTTGAPPPPLSMVQENRNIFRQAVERSKNSTILSNAPRLTEWVRNPENAAIAKDDLENLSVWENLAIVPRGIASALPAFNQGFYGLAAAAAGVAGKNPLQDFLLRQAQISAQLTKSVAGPSGGWFGKQFQGAAQSIGAMLPGIAASVATGGATAPGVAATYIIPGAITQGGQSAQKGLEKGLSSQRALLYGALDAAAEAVFERLPVGKLLGDVASGSGFGKILAHQLATEVPTEVATTLYQNLNEYATLTPDKTFGEFLAEQPEAIRDTIAQTILATVGVAGAGAGLSRFARERAKAQNGEATGNALADLSSKAQTSQLRNRSPDKFREFVERATANGPVENVYVPADQFATYFQSKGVDPHEVADSLEGVTRDDLDAALAGGSDLKIPTATYAARIAGTEHDVFLMENMRFDPDEFTPREAKEFNAHAQDILDEAWAEAEKAREETENLRSFEQEIYDTIVSRLRAAGRATDVATNEAMLYPAFYQAYGARNDMTPDEFMRQYVLPRIEGAIPDGMQFRNVDELTRTLAEARNRKAAGLDKRRSLLEFISDYGGINDVGGELRARDAETIKRPGKSTLKLARGAMAGVRDMFGRGNAKKHGVDDVAAAAVEIGYMADDPDVLAYLEAGRKGTVAPDITKAFWNAIDRELRGEKQFSAHDEVDHAAVEREKMLDQIEGYLDGLGVTLDDDDAIRSAIEKDGEGKRYAQGGLDRMKERYELGDAYLEGHRHPTEPGWFLEMIHVPQKERGKGIGRRLLQMAIDDADRNGVTLYLEPYSFEDGSVPGIDASTMTYDETVAWYERHGFVFNEDNDAESEWMREPQSAKHLFQSGPINTPRGSINFPAGGVASGESVIRLFEGADLSTFTHETGHFFLTVMQDLAARGHDAAATDLATVRDWWRDNAADVAKDALRMMPDAKVTADDVIAALDNGTTGDVLKDGAIDVGMQEQWARAFEAYLMEGNAPSVELRSAFEKFRAWLISIYKRLAGLNVTPSDELRGVFDRMLASDEQIAEAGEQVGETPVFTSAEAMGLTPEEYDRFLKLRGQAQDEAKAKLLRETMAPIKRARDKWFKEERAKTREEVERNVNAFAYFRAIEWMANKRWLGEGQPENLPDMRLSKDALVARYGAGVLKTLPRGKQAVYTTEGGLDPDEAAGWFGFGSGDELVRAMERAPKRTDAIEAETDKLMRERHGDALHDGEIEALALDAVHNDKRGQWIAAELKAVADVAGVKVDLTAKEARVSARQTVSRMKVRDAMNANRFLAAERKAGRDAARLGAMLARDKVWLDASRRKIGNAARAALRGDGSPEKVAPAVERFNAKATKTTTTNFTDDKGRQRTATSLSYNDLVAKLIEAKRRQLLNHALYVESRKVEAEVGKAESYIGRLNTKANREKIGGAGRRANAQIDYLAAIDDILDRYDFKRLSAAAEERRDALNAYVAAMRAAGRENELAVPDEVLRNAGRKPYKTIHVEELRGVIDSLKNIEHVAKRWDKLIDEQNEKALDEAVTEIGDAFSANVKKRPPSRVPTKGENVRQGVRQFFDLVLNATTILREIDGFKDGGAAYRNIKAPIDDAMTRLIGRKEKAAADLEKLYAVYSKAERRAMAVREHMPALGYALSKWERIAVALNMGNDGNRQRLTDPKVRGSLNEAQVEAVLATLDERDADFIQSVWDYVGSFRDDIAARERRATGVEPEWVEGSPVTIAGKVLRGGYYPLKYDARLSSLARDDEANDIAQAVQAGRFGKAQTRKGHLKARAQASGRDVELDMGVLHSHVNRVIYDLELSEAVSNSWRVLQDGRVRSAFTDAGKQADFDALETWLKDVAEGEIRSSDWLNRGARALKRNFTAAKLAFNLSTVAMQIVGLSQSMVVVGKKDMAVGIGKALANPIQSAEDVAAKSTFMRTRQTTFNKDIFDFYSDPKTGPVASRWGEIKSNVIGPAAFWLMTKVQWYAADVPTWIAGYHQGLRKFGNDEAKAIAHADDIVKRAQASGLFSDRSAIERGSVSRTQRQNDVVRLFTALGSYMFAKFNVAYERTQVAGRTIKDNGVSAASAKEALSYSLDMAFLFTLEAVLTAAVKGQLPGGDDEDDDGWLMFLAKQTGLAIMGTIPFVRDIAGPLQGYDGGGAYGSITKDIGAPFVQAAQGEIDKGLVRSAINATGLATGLPSTQINRAVDAAMREQSGEDVSPLEYLLGRSRK